MKAYMWLQKGAIVTVFVFTNKQLNIVILLTTFCNCMSICVTDGRLGFTEEDRAKIWKEHMEKIMNRERMGPHGENLGPVEKVARNEIVEAMQKMKSGKATGPSEESMEMVVASGEIGVKVMMELCLRLLNGRGMP